ncbi:butyrophilin-like protein 3 [Astyanax mexicanus]|uniref:Butyrophilin-like protein 3 n=1 Tax=Astyanax mexicanus TaxID=7994 RepID=A0A8T2LKM1_ASTMX|nr:butyrophilin-like protein 3 [Astyanax mexicanus]
MGSEPEVTVEKYESGKFSLLCESKGWRPESELQWRNSKGVHLTAETETQRVADLFNVKSRITVEKIDLYFCTVTQRVHVKEGRIDAHTLYEYVPCPWKTVGIYVGIPIVVLLLVGVPAGLFLYIKLLLKSDKDGRLKHHNLSPCQWWYVKRTLLNSEEDLKEFNLRKLRS